MAWYGMKNGMKISYHTTYHTIITYQVLQYASSGTVAVTHQGRFIALMTRIVGKVLAAPANLIINLAKVNISDIATGVYHCKGFLVL